MLCQATLTHVCHAPAAAEPPQQGALTALPLRCLWAFWTLLSNLLLPSRSRQSGSTDSNPSSSSTNANSSNSNASSNNRLCLLPGAQLYDLLCVLLMLGAVLVLSRIRPGVLYYWMKDITSEFLKIQVLFTALEICDKVCCRLWLVYKGRSAAVVVMVVVFHGVVVVVALEHQVF